MSVQRLTFEMNAVGNAVPEMMRVQRQLGQVNQSLTRATAGVSRYNTQIANTRRVSGRLGYGLGQLGLQVQDVAVQLGSGTSALRTFSMQGPQILSILGPWGMVAGAVAGVAASLALAGSQASSLSFDFRQFASDIGIDLDRVAGFMRNVMTRIKNGIAVSVNFIINGIRSIAAVIGALPAAFRAGFDNIKMQMNAFALSARAMAANVRASIQEMLDSFSPSGPMPGRVNATAAEDLRELAESLQSRADGIRRIASETTGFAGTIRDALSELEQIDIREYFSRAAEAVDGEGDGESPSLTDALTAAQQRMQDISQTMQSSFESGFMSIIDGTKSAQDAFRIMARDIIAQLYRVLVVQRLVGSFDAQTGTGTGIVGAIMGAFGGARANGGPVSAGRPYLVGERGPELVVPSRSGTVVPNNQIGGQQIVVNYSFQGGITEADLGRALPVLVERTKREVVDAVQRGGSVARVFR